MRFYSILFLMFFGLPVIASDSTGVSKWKLYNMGAFGGFGFNYLETGREAMGLNFQGGIIYNRWLTAGIQGNAFFTINPLIDKYTNDDANLLGGYGGLFVAPTIYSNTLLHASFPVLVGYGSISYELYDLTDGANRVEDSDGFWVFEPGIELELNLMKFIRIAVGGYYKYCSNVHLSYENGGENIVSKNILNNFSVGIRLRFGKF
ncbi:MAG: hypothetical protein LBL04_04275 [Bacteroidales bacterium]|jgi:hypothetical protein|nr:hypothetical protein [Bacteroidales bacterium]